MTSIPKTGSENSPTKAVAKTGSSTAKLKGQKNTNELTNLEQIIENTPTEFRRMRLDWWEEMSPAGKEWGSDDGLQEQEQE